jgi:hypothetical protein
MWYHPGAYLLRMRDVVAAWLVCIGIAACAVTSGLTG